MLRGVGLGRRLPEGRAGPRSRLWGSRRTGLGGCEYGETLDRASRRRSRRRAELRAALPAELLAGWIRMGAGRADERQARAALTAELLGGRVLGLTDGAAGSGPIEHHTWPVPAVREAVP